MRFRICVLGAVAAVSGLAIDRTASLELRSSSEAGLGPLSRSFSYGSALVDYIKRSITERGNFYGPSVVPSVGAYSYVGCYTESNIWRALRGKSYADDSMTVEVCAAQCSGFSWFGLEYARECYCGNGLEIGSVRESDGGPTSNCNMLCKGNSLEYCGGPARLQMYNNLNKASAPATSSSSSTTSSTKSSATSVTPTSSTAKPPGPTPSGRAVFAHYMIGGITQDQANTDVQQAKAMGIDAFALNVITATQSWSNDAISCLFNAANAAGFKLFFSFDMTGFQSPSDAIPLLRQYYTSPAYYKRNGLSFVSTFDGGTQTFGYSSPNAGWQAKYRDALNSLNIPTFFVPAFDDSPVDPSSFFNSFPVVDGLFAWENSWPWESQGKASVSSSRDQAYFSAAKAAGKVYMMGISSVQFKHISSGMNYYRSGGLNLALRISQVLSLGPDYVQIQTWNDGGESHYIGSVWPYAISGSNVGSYTNSRDHSGWQILLKPFISAYKAGITDISLLTPTGGASVQGVFWHSTLLSTASCSGDGLGKPSGGQNAPDAIEVAVIVAPGVTGVKVNVYSGGTQVGSYAASQGLNAWEVPGLRVGQVKVVVVSSTGSTLLSGTGSASVVADSSNCNYNPQVVALA